MKYKIFMLAAMLFASFGVYAQDSNNANTANSNSSTQSNANSVNGGLQNQQNFITNNPGKIDYSGSYTIKNVPGFGLGSFGNSFSSDYCSGTSQAAISGPGFGIGGGKQVLDEGCQLLRAADMTMRISGVKRASAASMWNSYVSANNVYLSQEQSNANLKPSSKAVIDGNGNVHPAGWVDTTEAKKQADMFLKASFAKSAEGDALEAASINDVCSISKKIRKNMVNAGVDCKD